MFGVLVSKNMPTCSTEREEDILEPERLLVGEVSARNARLVEEKIQLMIF